ncbi:hypothetical protein FSST1_007171 [Fusarium sambucinum]
MSPMNRLQALPDEIKLNIFSRLPDHNLAQLARASKQLNNIVTPLLWTDIEFHTQDYHNYQYIRQGPNYRSQPCIPQGVCLGSRRAKVFFTMLQTLHAEDPVRLVHVAERVKHLCADVLAQWEPPTAHDECRIRVWEFLPYFSNLESLGLRGDFNDTWDQVDPVQAITGPTPQLRSVKLSGYIPRSVPVWVLKAGNTLERLELAMLERPICSAWNRPTGSIPLFYEKYRRYDHNENSEAEYDDDDNGNDEDSYGDDGDENDDEESVWGSLNGDVIYPRPLGGYLTSYAENELKPPKLKHLHLCQPVEAECYIDWDDFGWSKRAEKACYRDWKKILKASVPTLSTLILDQRPATLEGYDTDRDEEDWVPENTVMFASDTLMKMIHKVLENSGQGPLEKVYLRGIAIPKGYGEPDLTESRARWLVDEPVVWFLDLLGSRGIVWKEETGWQCNFNQDSGHAFWECDSEEMSIRGSTSR